MGNFVGAYWTDLFGRKRNNGNSVSGQGHEFHSVSLPLLMYHNNRTNISCL